MSNPLLICMTPVRNEAWVLPAFLKATSLWADYIIIADQISTDGSREIALSYPKVILIDNTNPDFNEADRQKMLIDEARQIEGDKILFGLDADEIFSANFRETEDWKKVLESKPGDVFWFKWAEICPNKKEFWESDTSFPWMFHDDGKEPHGNYVRNMHSMRIPYPIEEKQMYYVNDFYVLHLAYLNEYRIEAKRRFYKFVDWELNKRSIVSLSRAYSLIKKKEKIIDLPQAYIYTKSQDGFNLFDEVDLTLTRFWFDNYIVERLDKYPKRKLYTIDMWDKTFITEFKLKDKRKTVTKFIHRYLYMTQDKKNKFFIKIIDKIIKKVGF